ncbi:FMN-dependent NADH-azoreductase [Steroidobacter agaridevorans]|uniref:FMN dependent NADH:quinone oxidoreductase n=1 Tax=Steroidobacter agaridevorans TaxID=2695856 RepID=A0A829YHB7_9GAMM|nr:NAD(P)H-dependent oxidoreductase [Steroidobacter agaridevorans]GFE82620.1 FMN-dependent NADH-azoreductase [Steroidobacter agaridevorans]GFE85064.1 FMN-dependent NADH-azoreductase [Steroidobacter agaridevorans]
MSKLLYIESAPLKSRSHTIAVYRAFEQAYRAAHPSDEIEMLDLWQMSLPPFDEQTIEAKFAVLRKNEFTPQQLERWQAVRNVSRHFNAADKYVFGVPMWNFGVPYVLKHYIDVVTLPGENWTWSPASGYGTLLSGKKALAIYASANLHAEVGAGAEDFQKPFMRRWLQFIGIERVEEITVAPTLSDPATLQGLRAEAIRAATELALHF